MQLVSFFRDREAHNGQPRVTENGLEPLPVVRFRIAAQRFPDAADDRLVHTLVGIHGHEHVQVVMLFINLFNQVGKIRFHRRNAVRHQALIQQPLLQGGNEGAENVAGAEVDPAGMAVCLLHHGRVVESGNGNPMFFPKRILKVLFQ